MATRPGPVPVTAAVVAGVLLAALGIVGGPAVRSTIGAGTSSVSLPGTGVVVAHAGDAGTLDAAGAADGAVVAIVSGVPTLTTVSTVTAYDPTTRHGEISVRVDAGGADVTALAAVDPGTAGQVLTVSDAGLPHWAAAAAGGSSLPDAAGVADGAVLVQVGGTQAWVGQPTTLAAQARAEAQRRRGPLVMRFPSASDYVSTSATTGSTTPMLKTSTSGVIVVYSTQAGSYASSYILHSGVNATRGFFLAISSGTGGDDLLIRSMSSSGNVDAWINSFVSTTGWHAVAWSIPSNGLSLRYSFDGGAVTASTPGTTPWPFTDRLPADAVTIGADGAGTGCQVPLAYIALWSSVLSDADLVTLSTSPSAGAPTLPSAPAWEWAAAAHAGAQSVTIGNARYDTTGSPRVWMP